MSLPMMDMSDKAAADQASEETVPSISVTNEDDEEVSLQATTATPVHTPASDFSAIRAVSPFNEDDARTIVRQVEYYFSDQNLPYDAHLLGLTGGDGNGPVDLKHILRWKKMRKFKPSAVVMDVLRQSAVLDLDDNGKKIKRRYPLMIAPCVAPIIDLEREHIDATLAENPHLTKNMLKPTGFESFYTDPPISPEQYEKDRKRYDPEFSIHTRLENAIRHYRTRRKMHQETLRVFELWMIFGGIDTSPQAYTGGFEDDEDLDKEEKAALKYSYQVQDYILDNEDDYEVDFQRVALAFLSTEFFNLFKYSVAHDARTLCNVMVNFFNFLLHHDVCPEYATQLLAARVAVQEAEPALCKIPAAEKSLQSANSFNAVCSVLHSEDYNTTAQSYWLTQHSGQLDLDNAMLIFQTGLLAFATEDQVLEAEQRFEEFKKKKAIAKLQSLTLESKNKDNEVSHSTASEASEHSNEEDDGCDTDDGYMSDESATTITAKSVREASHTQKTASKSRSPFAIVLTETIGLEIVALEFPDEDLTAYFAALSHTVVPNMGIMRCRQWKSPNAAPTDLPADRPRLPQEMTFIVDDDVLNKCDVGMKLEATVSQLDIGVCWIERLEAVHPKFYTTIPDLKELRKRRECAVLFDEWIAKRKLAMAESNSDAIVNSSPHHQVEMDA